MVYGGLGRLPFSLLFSIRCDKYWLRLLQQPDTLNSKQAYFISFTLHEQGKVTLVTHIKWLLCSNGFGLLLLLFGGGAVLWLVN